MSLLNFTYVCTYFILLLYLSFVPFFFSFFLNGEALIAYKYKINIELRVFFFILCYFFDNSIVKMEETNLNLGYLPSKYQKMSTN